jgi:predicted DNA-binding protein with PD1-like motif
MKACSSPLRVFVFRLSPKADLKKSIVEFAQERKIRAGVILTCVGSLERINVRFANQERGESLTAFFEIVSLTGTFSDTSCHLHIAVSTAQGNTLSGHLLDNNIVYTTAEIAVAELTDVEFSREIDPTYGYRELAITKKKE